MASVPSISRRPSASNQQGIFSSSLLSVGSSLKTVGNHAGRGLLKAVSAGYSHLTSDPTDRENVLYVKLSQLESKTTAGLQQQPVLLLGYENGFQVWDLQDCTQIQELVSRRDGAVRCASLAVAPIPHLVCAHIVLITSSPITPAAAFWRHCPGHSSHPDPQALYAMPGLY